MRNEMAEHLMTTVASFFSPFSVFFPVPPATSADARRETRFSGPDDLVIKRSPDIPQSPTQPFLRGVASPSLAAAAAAPR